MPKKIFTQELEGTRRRGRPKKGWKEEVERDLQVLGVRRWTELVADRKKNGRTLFNRPKPTVGCSANGRRTVSFPSPGTALLVILHSTSPWFHQETAGVLRLIKLMYY